ncbi:protein SidG [Legionella sainthelensi]|uniref:Protein SidG n=1 Tax=Legionella sainthelensi TaxID=28087 RepID=A0A0W0YJZ1_9GAMM|nr:hypothetical protein [Legionella sainthelensi]KTD56926.1 protein SidG [Legionella sainthelensi]VEH37178.1 protein SidG [Legionella sainthelensi]
MPKFDHSHPHVKVQTWGTSPDANSGLMSFLDARYRKENIGHASLEMRLPGSPENIALVNEFCYKDPQIPVEIKKQKKSDGAEEMEYVIRFSFIPSNNAPFSLNYSYKDDTNYERSGHHTTDSHYLEVSELEERRASKRVIRVFPACSLTEKGRALDFSTAKGQYILKVKEIENREDLLQTAKLLEKKCEALKGGKEHIDFYHPDNKTILIAAKRIDIVLPNGEFSREQLDNILNISEIKKKVQEQVSQLKLEQAALKEKVLQKDKTDENTRLIQALKSISEKVNDSNLGILPTEIETLKVPQNTKNELLILIDSNELEEFKAKLKNLCQQYQNENNQITTDSLYFFSTQDDYLCRGRPADAEIQLPLGTGSNELNAAAMLAQMRKIVDSGYHYDLYTHNCSSTVLTILRAGRDGIVSEVTPAKGFTTANPKTVYNQACSLRDKICPVSVIQALLNLDDFYASKAVDAQVVSKKSSTLDEAILNFTANNLFPENEDIENKTFYVFSAEDRDHLLKNKEKRIPTELLRDLWGIMPERTLPLSKDNSNKVVIDRNMTIGQLVQGLTLLAQNRAEDRLKIQKTVTEPQEKDAYEILKDKIKSELLKLEVKKDAKSVQKTADLAHAYSQVIKEINSANPPLNEKEKCAKLFHALEPILHVNTGFHIRTARSYTEVKKTAIELGIIERKESVTVFKDKMQQMRKENDDQTPQRQIFSST